MALKPVEDQAHIFRTWYQVGETAECRNDFDVLLRVIVPEDLDYTVRRTCEQQGLVVLVDKAYLVDPGAGRVIIGESIQPRFMFPVPDATFRQTLDMSEVMESLTIDRLCHQLQRDALRIDESKVAWVDCH